MEMDLEMTNYKRQRYLFMTTDPVHIGAGGSRLGRVDNSIVREPGTRVPIIPGTSLHGTARHYAARLYEKPEAAGKDHKGVDKPESDPVCYTFGYIKSKDDENKNVMAYSGVVSFLDASVLAFPVYSMDGPVWVTTPERLRQAGFIPVPKEIKTDESAQNEFSNWPDKTEIFCNWERSNPLNLGWLMFKTGREFSVKAPEKCAQTEGWKAIEKHLVLVHESLFGHIVNSNLDVRTSVAIDPKTGAAEDGALFTYEALPRATFLTSVVILDDYRRKWPLDSVEKQTKTSLGNHLPGNPWQGPLDVVRAGLQLISWLGIGGMGTRGFGRMTLVGEPQEEVYSGGIDE